MLRGKKDSFGRGPSGQRRLQRHEDRLWPLRRKLEIFLAVGSSIRSHKISVECAIRHLSSARGSRRTTEQGYGKNYKPNSRNTTLRRAQRKRTHGTPYGSSRSSVSRRRLRRPLQRRLQELH